MVYREEYESPSTRYDQLVADMQAARVLEEGDGEIFASQASRGDEYMVKLAPRYTDLLRKLHANPTYIMRLLNLSPEELAVVMHLKTYYEEPAWELARAAGTTEATISSLRRKGIVVAEDKYL